MSQVTLTPAQRPVIQGTPGATRMAQSRSIQAAASDNFSPRFAGNKPKAEEKTGLAKLWDNITGFFKKLVNMLTFGFLFGDAQKTDEKDQASKSDAANDSSGNDTVENVETEQPRRRKSKKNRDNVEKEKKKIVVVTDGDAKTKGADKDKKDGGVETTGTPKKVDGPADVSGGAADQDSQGVTVTDGADQGDKGKQVKQEPATPVVVTPAQAPKVAYADIPLNQKVAATIQSIQSVGKNLAEYSKMTEDYRLNLPIYKTLYSNLPTVHAETPLGNSARPALIVAQNMLELASTEAGREKLKGVSVSVGGGKTERAFPDSVIADLEKIASRATRADYAKDEDNKDTHGWDFQGDYRRLVVANKADAKTVVSMLLAKQNDPGYMEQVLTELPDLVDASKWATRFQDAYQPKAS